MTDRLMLQIYNTSRTTHTLRRDGVVVAYIGCDNTGHWFAQPARPKTGDPALVEMYGERVFMDKIDALNEAVVAAVFGV